MNIRSLESHIACLIGGVCVGVLIMWQAGQGRPYASGVASGRRGHRSAGHAVLSRRPD